MEFNVFVTYICDHIPLIYFRMCMSKKVSLQTLPRHLLTKSKSSNSFCVSSALNGEQALKSR